MTGRKEQLSSLSKIIEDYRQDEISPRSPELIDDWLQQFPREVQGPVLWALLHILEKTYISKEVFRSFLAGLASTDKLSPGSPLLDSGLELTCLTFNRPVTAKEKFLTFLTKF